jgi:hypothetical protein
MALCAATTKKGEPCMRHTSEGSTLCYLHGGMVVGAEAQLSEPPGLKHGFYRRSFTEDEYKDLIFFAQDMTLVDELAMGRVQLRRIVNYIEEHEKGMTPDEYARVSGLVWTGLNTIRRLVESVEGTGPDMWDIVLNQLSIDLGMDL